MTTTKTAARKGAAKTPGLAPGDRWCSQHHRPLSECDPAQAHVYSVRLRKDLVERAEAAGGGDLSDFIRQAVERAVEQAGTGPEADPDRALAAALAELAEMKRRVRIAQGSLRSILDSSGEPAPADGKAAVVADLAPRTEQIALGRVPFREP